MKFSRERGTPVDRVQTKHLWGRIHGGRVNIIKTFSVESSAKRGRQKFSTWKFLFSVSWPEKRIFAGGSQLESRQPTAVLESVHATSRQPRPSPHIPQTSPCEAPLPPPVPTHLESFFSFFTFLSLALSFRPPTKSFPSSSQPSSSPCAVVTPDTRACAAAARGKGGTWLGELRVQGSGFKS